MNDTPKLRRWRAPAATVSLVVVLWGLGRLPTWAGAAAAAILAIGALLYRKPLYRGLTGLPFAGSLLTALLMAVALGTFIPQGLSPAALAEKYGAGPAGFLRILGLDDLFHSFPFRGVLAVLALCMILVIIRRRAWRPPDWGPFLAHGGVATILAGSLIGNLWGRKGYIELRPGETASSIKIQDPHGRPTAAEMNLGFVLRLDEVDLERYPEEYRLYLYRPKGERWEALTSLGSRETGRWRIARGTGREFRLLRLFPDFDVRMELRAAPPGTGVPALQIRLAGREPPEAVLLAGVKDREELRVDRDRSLRFVWTEGKSTWTEARPEEHRIWMGGAEDPHDQALRVRPGASYPLAAGRYDLEVMEFFPDFVFDLETRRASSRSDRPRNPVLRVALKDRETGRREERWLFPGHPELGRGHGHPGGGPDLRYQYIPPVDPADHEIVVVGKTREILEYRRGVLQGRRPLPEGSQTEMTAGVVVERLWPWAEEEPRYLTRSGEWRRPVAEIEVREGDRTASALLEAGESMPLGREGHVLAFEKKRDEAKVYRSRVSILKGGTPLRVGTLLVNHPLSHGGFRFYQSRYDERGPSSGILVVRDPGLGVVYVGFAMVSLGLIVSLFFRRRPETGGGGPSP